MENLKRIAGSFIITVLVLVVLVLIGAAGAFAMICALQYPKIAIGIGVAAFFVSCWCDVYKSIYD